MFYLMIYVILAILVWAAFEMAAPKTEHEQELDDRDQIDYLRGNE